MHLKSELWKGLVSLVSATEDLEKEKNLENQHQSIKSFDHKSRELFVYSYEGWNSCHQRKMNNMQALYIKVKMIITFIYCLCNWCFFTYSTLTRKVNVKFINVYDDEDENVNIGRGRKRGECLLQLEGAITICGWATFVLIMFFYQYQNHFNKIR